MAFELFRKKDLAKQPQHRYDPEKVEPVIQSDRDLDTFRKQYGIEGKIETIY